MQSGTNCLASDACVTMLARWFVDSKDAAENLLSICRRLISHFGRATTGKPILDLGTALTKAKCKADGLPHENAHCFAPMHVNGIQALMLLTRKRDWIQLRHQCLLGGNLLNDFLWDDEIGKHFSSTSDHNDVHEALLNACLVLKDVEIMLELHLTTDSKEGLPEMSD